MNFARNLRKLLEGRGLNPNSAAATWSLPQRTLAVHTGEDPIDPRLSTVERIAEAAGVSVLAMLSDDFDPGEAALIERYRSLSPPERAAFLRGLGISQPDPSTSSSPVPKATPGEAPARRRKSDRAAA